MFQSNILCKSKFTSSYIQVPFSYILSEFGKQFVSGDGYLKIIILSQVNNTSNSCIMCPSDLPDMYTHCTMWWATNHPSQYEETRWIYYIESLVKFDYGSAASNVAVTFVTINGKIL